MKKLLTTTALVLSLSFSGLAYANDGPHGGFMKEVLSKLPAEKADAFRNILKEGREKNAGLREQTKKLHDELYTIITAPKFNKTTFLAKKEELRTLHDKMAKSKDAAFANALAGLTQEERTSVADGMRAMHEKYKHADKPDDGAKSDGDEKPADGAQ